MLNVKISRQEKRHSMKAVAFGGLFLALWFQSVAVTAQAAAPSEGQKASTFQGPAHVANESADDPTFCPEAIAIYEPAKQPHEPTNLTRVAFQVMSPDGKCTGLAGMEQVESADLTRLGQAFDSVMAESFANSRASFGVMVRYTLTANAPAAFDMKTRDTTEEQSDELNAFYRKAAALDGFRSKRGTVYVVFLYDVEPSKR